jgi:hypothetical protein
VLPSWRVVTPPAPVLTIDRISRLRGNFADRPRVLEEWKRKRTTAERGPEHVSVAWSWEMHDARLVR